MNNTYLCHHGIKGQKWGVRREQDTVSQQNSNTPKKDNGKLKFAGGLLVGALVATAAVGAGAAWYNKRQAYLMQKKIHEDRVYWGKVGAAVRAQNARAAAYEKERLAKGMEYVNKVL